MNDCGFEISTSTNSRLFGERFHHLVNRTGKLFSFRDVFCKFTNLEKFFDEKDIDFFEMYMTGFADPKKDQVWIADGETHREDGPAIIREDGTKEWYLFDKLHRLDGPAIESPMGNVWLKRGVIHRDGAPAIEWNNGTSVWVLNGVVHRTDGPAVSNTSGAEEWIVNGVIHRENGPAIIESDGHQAWIQNGIHHRTDGPAKTWPDGSEEWWQNGLKHRTDGPAVTLVLGKDVFKEYWINGKKSKNEEFFKKKLEKLKSKTDKMS